MEFGEAKPLPQTGIEKLLGSLSSAAGKGQDYLNSKIYHESGVGLGDI